MNYYERLRRVGEACSLPDRLASARRKSPRSGSGDCVTLRHCPDGRVEVTDSKLGTLGRLCFQAKVWDDFVGAVAAGRPQYEGTGSFTVWEPMARDLRVARPRLYLRPDGAVTLASTGRGDVNADELVFSPAEWLSFADWCKSGGAKSYRLGQVAMAA